GGSRAAWWTGRMTGVGLSHVPTGQRPEEGKAHDRSEMVGVPAAAVDAPLPAGQRQGQRQEVAAVRLCLLPTRLAPVDRSGQLDGGGGCGALRGRPGYF